MSTIPNLDAGECATGRPDCRCPGCDPKTARLFRMSPQENWAFHVDYLASKRMRANTLHVALRGECSAPESDFTPPDTYGLRDANHSAKCGRKECTMTTDYMPPDTYGLRQAADEGKGQSPTFQLSEDALRSLQDHDDAMCGDETPDDYMPPDTYGLRKSSTMATAERIAAALEGGA